LAAVVAISALLCPGGLAEQWAPRLLAYLGGLIVGVVLSQVYWSRYRALGFISYALIAALVVLLVAGEPEGWPTWLVGVFAGLMGLAGGALVRYRVYFRGALTRNVVAEEVLAAGIAIGLVVVFAATASSDPAVRRIYRWLLVGLTVWAAGQAWLTLLRPAIELAAEPLLWVLCRVRATGPGLDGFPRTGPVLVIANHAAWFDPLYLGKVLPRVVTPMMTARFYNLPILRPILRYVIGVIVVPEKAIRREAPEVNEAIAALDAGRVVVIFPEGYLRRKEEPIIRRFGQGSWQILQARPETPVVACWIEGSWGSYTSYQNGPPTKNKKLDIRRPIGIGMAAPEVVPADVLAEHLPARIYLMNRVLEARKHLGLPPVPPVELPARDEPAEEAEGT
jgi:1-acyl-sn-glycerol-3-phosphate acyltransferase